MLLGELKENPGLFLPLECKSGGHDEPIVTRYSLGWTVKGPMEDQKRDCSCSLFPHKGKSVDSPPQHRAV